MQRQVGFAKPETSCTLSDLAPGLAHRGPPTQGRNVSEPARLFLVHIGHRATLAHPLIHYEHQKRPWASYRKGLSMGRVSKQTHASAFFVAAATSLAAMAAYNVYRARKTEREYPATGRFLTVDGVRLHYIEKGEGPPVALLHGNVVTAEDFGLCSTATWLRPRTSPQADCLTY